MWRNVMRIALCVLTVGAFTTVVTPGAHAVSTSGQSATPVSSAPRTVRVMTRNLDEGTDFGYVTAVAAGQLDFPTAVGLTYLEVVRSNVCRRAARIADEIAVARPDLVSVQEAAVWTGPIPVNCPGAATPTTIDAEAALLNRLAADGAQYTVVKELDEFSSAPLGLVPPGLSFLDRDVLLARVQPTDQLSISNVQAQHYSTLVPVLGLPILRGWISADVSVGAHPVRVISTHLESFYEPVQQAQGAELAAGPANTALPVIVAGDLNTGPGSDQQATYNFLTGTAGFTDAWAAVHPTQNGYTDAFYTEDPYTPTSGPTERIDLILVRGAIVPLKVALTGLTAPHPSDHAGVVAALRLRSVAPPI